MAKKGSQPVLGGFFPPAAAPPFPPGASGRNRTKLKKRLLCLALLLTLLATGCGATGQQGSTATDPNVRTSGTGFYFDTVVTLTLYGADATLMQDLLAACQRYENLLSRTIPQSDVGRINAAGGQPVTVDPETAGILRRALEISEMTGRAFCVTIAPLTSLWDFSGGTHRMPTQEQRLAALPLVDDTRLKVEGNQVTLPAGMQIDLGGIAKGYIADQLSRMCVNRSHGALLNFGGNVYVVGQKPDGSPFRVGVRDPQDSGRSLAVISMGAGTVVTSGVYERCFEENGVFYHHILDPETGLPAETDLSSATVVGQSSMDADALATALIVMGKEKALTFCAEHDIDAMLIDRDDQVICTPGFEEAYALRLDR